MFFISLIFLPYLDFDNLSLSILFLIYLTSWISTIAFLLVTKAIRHMEVTNVSPLLSFGPVFVLISNNSGRLTMKESGTEQGYRLMRKNFNEKVNKEVAADELKEIIKQKRASSNRLPIIGRFRFPLQKEISGR